jgi:hypothetical protein
MFRTNFHRHSFEVLESRIAPASVIDGTFVQGQVGSRIDLSAGEGLSTGGDNGGSYMLFVEQGRCLVFTTDLNNNGQLDFNEITGISAGNGLSLICFADIHGDIVTNLKPNGFLSDSDSNAANDPAILGGDGRILLDSRIEKIEMRSLTVNDIRDVDGDGVVNEDDLATRLVLSSYSIFGNIYAGTGFGSADGGLLIDSTGLELQELIFDGTEGNDLFIPNVRPSIGSIKIGTAASGDYFSFGASRADNTQGFIVPFVPKPGVSGGDIVNIRAASTTMRFTIDSLEAGGGGTSARGGNIVDIALFGDDGGGYRIIAGDGGRGPNGGDGGLIVNFSDRNSVTSFVLLQSGSGGEGLTGRGGDGGAITLGTFTVTGNVNIELGNGGTGFTAGGNGASFPRGVIIAPDGPDATTGAIVASWHDFASGTLGSYASVDFDLDGIGDYVFTSVNPGQLVVGFGDGLGGMRGDFDENGVFRLERFYLNGFANSEALTVGDFNGDGNPDIATGSFSEASFAGVRTFISQYVDLDDDGIAETFTGFSRGIESALPSLFVYNNGLFSGAYRSATPISDMATGDFDGDGVTDIMLTATYRDLQDTSTGQILIFMKGDAEANAPDGTGSFYADFGTREDTSQDPPIPANYFTPFQLLSDDQTRSFLEVFRLSATDDHDVVGVGINGQRNFRIFDNYFGGAGGGAALAVLPVPLGRVDVDRDANQQNQVDATFRDFTAVDYDNDGDIDFAVILQDPSAFMVTFTQSAPASFTINSGTGDNAGIRLGSNGLNLGDTFVAIVKTDADGDGTFAEVAILDYAPPGPPYYQIEELAITTGSNGATPILTITSLFNNQGRSEDLQAFDVYPDGDYGVGLNTGLPNHVATNEFPKGGYFEFENEFGLAVVAGDGGGSLIGRGGIGGSLGSGLTGVVPDPDDPDGVDPTGTLFITYSPTASLTGITTLVAGNGGNGFTSGGKGGSVTGVSAREVGATRNDGARILAGNGGFGVSGPGGAGGDIRESSIERGLEYFAGNGGSGKVGGAGGSILGNGIARAFDTETPQLEMHAGIGGTGVKRGGDGGRITNFVIRFPILSSGPAGPLILTGGDGGSAISGRGGNGGSVTNTSPLSDENGLALEIFVEAGDGGNGISGGHGGSIVNFINRPTVSDTPTILSFLAGNGGSATTGKGGNGGNLTNIATPSTGDPTLPPVSGFSFNRFLAGDGGSSSGNAGGNGGTVSKLNVSASSGAMAVVGGAGGAGLQSGGRGGSVLSSVVSSGGPDTGGKVLVVAGAGGDASAFTDNSNETSIDNEPNAFGGKVGRGGNGGSIIGFIQQNSIDVSVDLIAGNGGSTVNYGTSLDSKVFVGKGGSIKNIHLNGTIGNTDPTRKIKAYNDTIDTDPLPDDNGPGDGITDVTMQQWVNDFLRNPAIPVGLGDGIGNVGIVTGAAGRIKAIEVVGGGFETQPASGATKLNGSVQNVTARLLMSAVAGDVNRIAAIHVAKNINIGGGLVGSDKVFAGVAGVKEYRDVDGDIIETPVLGGGLIDGAFISDNRVPEIDGKPRVFIL